MNDQEPKPEGIRQRMTAEMLRMRRLPHPRSNTQIYMTETDLADMILYEEERRPGITEGRE